MEVNIPKPEMTDYQRVEIATENAFNALVDEAVKIGLPVVKPMGLMYLPTQELTRQFQEVCRAILESLKAER